MRDPDNDNDRLEEFFRKAALKTDVTFNEEDWKKLEARLDATDDPSAPVKKVSKGKIAAAVVAGVILLSSSLYWFNSHSNFVERDSNGSENTNGEIVVPEKTPLPPASESTEKGDTDNNGKSRTTLPLASDERTASEERSQELSEARTTEAVTGNDVRRPDDIHSGKSNAIAGEESEGPAAGALFQEQTEVLNRDRESVYHDLILITPAIAGKNKQRADVKLPGAEEVETSEVGAIVKEEHASDNKEHVAPPKLSLLLSFAPDFSSTSSQYTTPGKAFGAMIHYHFLPRWSFAAGAVKNNKRYTGAGEDYTPPKGYWKYYTNGVVPETVDGSCSVLEFPVMVQYTVSANGKHRWLVGAGSSSYLMLSETYLYNFEEPNPGAKERWDSKRSSRFLFNMVNFTIGYEYHIAPGLMVGIEPYVKIPLEEIGWTNIKLFSTGASFTLRYRLLKRKDSSMPVRSRGPD